MNRFDSTAKVMTSFTAACFARSSRSIVGVNVGANKEAADRIADYAAGRRRVSRLSRLISPSTFLPNTPGLRDLQQAAQSTNCWRGL